MFSINKHKTNEPSKPQKKVRFFEYDFLVIEQKNLDMYNPNLKLFELKMSQTYSLGLDSFTIDHGKDYFSFFKRLGNVNYFIIQHNDNKIIVGTSCAILRNYILPNDSSTSLSVSKKISYWYLCDLKIDKEHRGQDLTTKMFLQMFYGFIGKSRRGYLISMDPGSQQIIHIFDKLNKFLPMKTKICKLLIYSVPIKIMIELEKIFITAFINISYLSLNGVKDLLLTSTNKPLELYHLQHGPYAAITGTKHINELPDTATVMFCLPNGSLLEKILLERNVTTNIMATIISLSMNFFDWHNILTSDI